MSTFKQRKNRFYEEIENLDEVYTFLNDRFLHKSLEIKYDVESRKATINEVRKDEKIVMIVTDESYEPHEDMFLMVSGLVDKYFEIDFHIEEVISSGYFKCVIHAGRKAKTGRSDLRFKITKGDAVATKFKVSKHTIELNNFSIPTGIKVILDQYESSKKGSEDIFKVDYFKTSDSILNKMKKTGHGVLISDLLDSESYKPVNDEFIDYHSELAGKLDGYILKCRDKGFKSLMIIPIIYIADSGNSVPFAYIKMISKTRNYSLEDVFSIKEDTFKLVDRIREANTITLNEKQNVLDISKGGCRLIIENDELKRYFMKARGFVFDIVFKLQQPITIYGEIKFTGVDNEKNLLLGLSFSGNTSRKNQMKHLYTILQPMEIDYKKRLIEQMKRQNMK